MKKNGFMIALVAALPFFINACDEETKEIAINKGDPCNVDSFNMLCMDSGRSVFCDDGAIAFSDKCSDDGTCAVIPKAFNGHDYAQCFAPEDACDEQGAIEDFCRGGYHYQMKCAKADDGNLYSYRTELYEECPNECDGDGKKCAD